ncbi:hypothetical protein EVAR_34192_1 [Eumeta japonica]|uniref:Uncharacterized protein n=1 Tax=Eumeta variegata TaxID=151549 RepID=A0A4C1WKN9_EUMVA|nr:hypothetical protein EVAR_34192_1 [Eumeta japonica]
MVSNERVVHRRRRPCHKIPTKSETSVSSPHKIGNTVDLYVGETREPGSKLKNKPEVKIECGIGIRIESLIGIGTQKIKELFALGFVQIGNVVGIGIRIESGTRSRIRNGNRIIIESGTKIENGTGIENECGIGIRIKCDWDRNRKRDRD